MKKINRKFEIMLIKLEFLLAITKLIPIRSTYGSEYGKRQSRFQVNRISNHSFCEIIIDGPTDVQYFDEIALKQREFFLRSFPS